MMRLLMCLALLLVPLSTADACPGKKGPCDGQCVPPLVSITDQAQGIMDTAGQVAGRASARTNKVAYSVTMQFRKARFEGTIDEDQMARIGERLMQANIFLRLAQDDLKDGGKYSALATVSDGAIAVANKLRAAACFTEGTDKLNQAYDIFMEVQKEIALRVSQKNKAPC